jgi:hypothetical protein
MPSVQTQIAPACRLPHSCACHSNPATSCRRRECLLPTRRIGLYTQGHGYAGSGCEQGIGRVLEVLQISWRRRPWQGPADGRVSMDRRRRFRQSFPPNPVERRGPSLPRLRPSHPSCVGTHSSSTSSSPLPCVHPPPRLAHSCARHRNEATARPRPVFCRPSDNGLRHPRTGVRWIPLTSTGTRVGRPASPPIGRVGGAPSEQASRHGQTTGRQAA